MRLEAMGAFLNLGAALIIVLTSHQGWNAVGTGVAGLVLTYTQQVQDTGTAARVIPAGAASR